MQQDAPAPAPSRVVGIDVARALAILGMIWVNFKYQMDAAERGPATLVWASDRIDGRAAALFVVLAGLGVSLRSRRVRHDPSAFGAEARALGVRAAVLFVIGMLFVHLWPWDILHAYGLYLVLTVPFLRLPTSVLWLAAAVVAPSGLFVRDWYTWPWGDTVWTPLGLVGDLWVSGLHPALPWFAFVLVGMAVGRLDLADRSTRRRLLAVALPLALITEGLGIAAIEGRWADAWQALPRPPGPLFIAAGSASAVALIGLCVEATQSRARAGWVVALVATGQLAFTWYIAHAVAILVPLQHGWFDEAPLWVALAYGGGCFALAVLASLWWRRRYPLGPLEGLIRQLTGRATPAPWGGRTLV